MLNRGPTVTDEEGCWRWRALTFLVIAGAAILRLVYLASNCPLDLSPDEAHYWDWSRHLDWSYYSKGPLVAYLIRGACLLAGPWSERLVGSEMLAVRLPAILCRSLMLLGLYVLTAQVYRREKLAFAVVAAALTLPVVAVGSSLMTIDAPYTCCWVWALVLGHRAIFRGSAWAWPAAGLVVGLGILAKYTMLLWVPAAGLFLLTTPGYRRLLWRPGFWSLSFVGAACCIPILVWNMNHDWVSWHHVGGQAGVYDSPGILWLGPLKFVGTQFALLLGYWFVGWAAAMVAFRPWRDKDPGQRYLWWMSALMFLVFFLASLRTEEEPNWPVTAYLSGLVLTVAWLAREFGTAGRGRRRLAQTGLATAGLAGVLVSLAVHHTDWLQPQLLALSGPATVERPLPLRRFDPTCRLRGWREFAAEVDRVRDELAGEAIEPALAGDAWVIPGEIGFYCAGHPAVYSLGSAMGDRRSQYDLWHPSPLWDQEAFLGRTIIYVGEIYPVLVQAFDQVEPSRIVTYREQKEPIATWKVTVCRGYRGLPLPRELRN